MRNWKKTFFIIWSGQLFSILSSSIVSFSIILWLSIKEDSAQVLAYAALANLLPSILLGLFIGVYIDRWNRKRTMIIADSFVAFCSAILAILFYFDVIETWQIYLLLALRSVGSAFHAPAMQASVPLLAPKSELMRISGINQIIHSISNIAGPALGAFFIVILDMSVIIVMDVVGAIIACVALIFVHIPNPEKIQRSATNVWSEMKEGVGYLFAKRGLSYLFGGEIVATFFIIPIGVLFPLMTLNHFKGSSFEIGIVEVAWGVGMLLGGLFIGQKWVKNTNKSILINTATIIMGACFALSGFLPGSDFSMFVALTAFAGMACSIYWSTFMVMLQTHIEPSALGRVFSIFDSISLIPTLPGLLATGFIAEQIGIPNAFIIAGIIILLVGIASFCIPSIMKLGKEK